MDEKSKDKLLAILITIFGFSIFFYAISHNSAWVKDIIPEFIGIAWFAIIIFYGVKKTTRLTSFFAIFGGIFILALAGYIFGSYQSVDWLVDIMPEFLGATAVALIASIVFKRKMFIG